MLDLLHHAFGWLCGQNPAHTWTPGGELLPLCQRCTGVYAGAFVSVLLHLARAPAPEPRWLWLNGMFLLFMIPSGFYWIPQNPELRCASGILFGFGLVAYFWLLLPGVDSRANRSMAPQTDACNAPRPARAGSSRVIAGTLIAALVLVPLLAEYGNAAAAGILTFASVAGAMSLAGLLAANHYVLFRWLVRRFSTTTA